MEKREIARATEALLLGSERRGKKKRGQKSGSELGFCRERKQTKKGETKLLSSRTPTAAVFVVCFFTFPRSRSPLSVSETEVMKRGKKTEREPIAEFSTRDIWGEGGKEKILLFSFFFWLCLRFFPERRKNTS